MRRNEIIYVNNNIHNNPHLLSALLNFAHVVLVLAWCLAHDQHSTGSKTKSKALQENPAQQELPEEQGCLGAGPPWSSWLKKLILGDSNLGLHLVTRVSQPKRGHQLRHGPVSQAHLVCVSWSRLRSVLSGDPT